MRRYPAPSSAVICNAFWQFIVCKKKQRHRTHTPRSETVSLTATPHSDVMPGASAPQRALHDGAVRPGASTAPGATPDQAGPHLTRPAAQHSPPRSTHSPARSSTRSPRRTRHVAPAAGPPAAPHTSSPVHTAAAPTAASTLALRTHGLGLAPQRLGSAAAFHGISVWGLEGALGAFVLF